MSKKSCQIFIYGQTVSEYKRILKIKKYFLTILLCSFQWYKVPIIVLWKIHVKVSVKKRKMEYKGESTVFNYMWGKYLQIEIAWRGSSSQGLNSRTALIVYGHASFEILLTVAYAGSENIGWCQGDQPLHREEDEQFKSLPYVKDFCPFFCHEYGKGFFCVWKA